MKKVLRVGVELRKRRWRKYFESELFLEIFYLRGKVGGGDDDDDDDGDDDGDDGWWW